MAVDICRLLVCTNTEGIWNTTVTQCGICFTKHVCLQMRMSLRLSKQSQLKCVYVYVLYCTCPVCINVCMNV